uniref:BEACH domain-containing protein n=1 Tax=Corethron hystrix TaxID=216773 RepID=A0A7S1BQY0_9STRA|mmetsp:Transcript_35096/g.81159  ORF Transcript_35096/g.81159 Transcript_35096/m.81159 type:complete len:980 (+) Transcript_35096:1981-4920(+)
MYVCQELIPEFYDTSTPPDFLINAQSLSLGNTQTGVRVHDVRLPTWSRSPRDFIRKNRQALESRHVRSNLPSWIDLIFGIHARGKEARDRHNVFYRTAYLTSRDVEEIERVEDVDAAELEAGEFGICPDVLFVKSHPFSMDSREDKDKEQETCRQNRSDNNDETDDNFVARDNDRSGLVDESDSQKMTVANMTINISSSSNNSLHSNQIASGNGSNSNNGVYNNNSCSSQWEMVAVPSDNNASRSRCSSYNSVDTSSMGSVATFSSQGSGGSGAMVGTAIVGGVFSGSGATVCVRRRAGSGVFVGEKVTGSGGTGILLSSTTTNNITAKNNSNSSKRNISHGGGGGTETSATSNNGAVNQNDNSIMGPARAWFKGIVTRSKSSVVLAPSSSSSEQPLQQQQQHDDGVMVERRDSSSLVDVDDDMNGTVLKDSNDDDDVVSIRNAGSSLSNLDPLFRKQSVGRTFSSLNQHKTASIIVQQEAGALLRFDAETDSGVETTPFSYSHVPVPPVGPAKAIPSDVVVDITLKILAWRRPHADALSSISISPYRRHHKHRTTPDDHYRRYTVASASRDGSVKMSDLSVPNTECCSSSSSQKQRRPARRKHQQPGLMLQQSHSLGTMPLSCIVLAEDGYGGNVAIVGGYDDRVTILSASPSRPQSSHESDTGTIATTAQWYLGATTTADVVHTSLTGAILASFHGHSDTVSSLHIVGCTDPLVSTHSLVTSGWDACVKVFPLDFSFDGVEVREDLVVELYDAESAVCGVGAVVIQAPSAEGEKEEEDHTGRGGSQRRRRTAISAGCDDGTIIVWLQGDTGSFEMVYKHTAETSGSPCTVIKFATPHTNDSTTYIYAAFQSGRIIQLSLCGHNVKIIGEMILESQILDMTVSSPHFIFCTCQDGSLRVLHLPAGIVSQEIPVRALRAIHGAKSPAIGAVAVVKGDGEEQENRCKDNGLCHDGFLCATGADDGSVVIFELCPKFHTLT